MQKNIEKKVDFRAEYFSKVFSARLASWKEKKRKEKKRRYTDEDFAKAIEKACGRKCSRNSIVSWKNGERYPEQFIEAICKVLEVKEEFFFPILTQDRLAYDQTYIDEHTEELRRYAERKGMSESFLHYLESMPDFSGSFPFTQFDDESKYFLKHNADGRKVSSLYQVSDDADHRLYLNKKDIDYITRLQSEAWTIIKLLFQKERERRLEKLIQRDCEIWSENLNGVPTSKEIKQCIKTDWKDLYIMHAGLTLREKASQIVQKAYFEALDKMLLENPDFEYTPRSEKELRALEEDLLSDVSPEYEEMMRRYNLAQDKDLTEEQYDSYLEECKRDREEDNEKYIESLMQLEKEKSVQIRKRKERLQKQHGKHKKENILKR